MADEQVTSLSSAGSTFWTLGDQQGSIRDVVDSAGNLRLHRVFDQFGNVVLEKHYDTSGTQVTAGQTGYIDEAFEYTGRWFDKTTGLQNNLNRWYDPVQGRFMSEDPLGLGPDPNPYRYVENSPMNGVDPTGTLGLGPGYGVLPVPVPSVGPPRKDAPPKKDDPVQRWDPVNGNKPRWPSALLPNPFEPVPEYHYDPNARYDPNERTICAIPPNARPYYPPGNPLAAEQKRFEDEYEANSVREDITRWLTGTYYGDPIEYSTSR